jgi:hypothetical protein
MELLNNKLKQILLYLEEPGTMEHIGNKQICYLTFPVEMVLDVKKNTETMISLIKHYKYEVQELSMGNEILNFIKNNSRRKNWMEFSKVEYVEEMNDFFKGLSSTINENEVLENAILSKQRELIEKKKPLLLLTDLEGIHPYTRFGPVEQKIYNNIQIPIIILYPGELSGSSLEFLGYYPPDGNYRSKHY